MRTLQKKPLRPLPLLVMALGLIGSGSSALRTDDIGVLVMAHGGTPAWNAAIQRAVEPFRAHGPVAVAFGMADPVTLQAAVTELEAERVTRIAVVRLFISQESFLHQTEYLLGTRPDPPSRLTHHRPASGAEEADPQSATTAPIDIHSAVTVSRQGMVESLIMGEIAAQRARGLSRSPRIAPFRAVRVETLREDWAEERAVAEGRIRDFVTHAAADSGVAIVIPFRVNGFGPYAEVLDGLSYRADSLGLVPHPLVTEWIEQQLDTMLGQVGWPNPFKRASAMTSRSHGEEARET